MKEEKLKKQNNSCQRPTTNDQTQSGITLVALVITIIILLILAGVAMSMITGQEGLFGKAENAATKYNESAENEKNLFEKYLYIDSILEKDLYELIKTNAIGFPNYTDENRTTITSGTEYTAEDDLWIIVDYKSYYYADGSLTLVIDGKNYRISQGLTNWDYHKPSQSLFPIKKGSTFKATFASGIVLYKVGMLYNEIDNEYIKRTNNIVKGIVTEETVGFPKYNDENRSTITSGTEYTADENCWLIANCTGHGDGGSCRNRINYW